MDGRRKRRTALADEGRLALVRAAAWAWYQRGSGNEGRAASESDLARPGRLQPRPSRFKLEAAAAAAAAGGDELLAGVSPAQRSQSRGHARGVENSFLQDRPKVERVVGHMDGDVAVVDPRRGGSLYRVAGVRGGRKQGFWVRHAVGFCGSGADVAEARALVGGRRPQLRLEP